MAINEQGILTYNDYPDALARLHGALHSQEGNVILVDAKPSYEFVEKHSKDHAGGGAHGSLHKVDSIVPLIVAGTEDRPEFQRLVDIKEWILRLVSGTLGTVKVSQSFVGLWGDIGDSKSVPSIDENLNGTESLSLLSLDCLNPHYKYMEFFVIIFLNKKELVQGCVGLETNRRDRDLALPKYREDLLKAIEEDLLVDENILGIFYGGSLANENTDLYSDIDLRIVVKDDVFEGYRLNKKQRANNWGRVLFYEDFPWSTYSIAHYDTFVKVDTFYYRVKDIQPSVWLQNIKIVRDTDSLLKNVLEKSATLTYSPSVEELEFWRTKFFAYVHEIYRRVMRNEIYYALRCLDNIRLSITTGWYMDAGLQPNTFGDWAKLEGNKSKLTEEQLNLLEQWCSSRDSHEILQVVKNIIPEFLKVHNSLCGKLEIDENLETIEEILNLVF
ncbi:aminoglycoside 6-adenylyltransferase [Ureibacillus sp. MALMAid1270]|uniref:aminoglycoside 6-adenylyltransferase n=1 Tax=Ureibacillus sp. MALMAid1270 TaxID=3411629 RepID=UPI003BA6A50C